MLITMQEMLLFSLNFKIKAFAIVYIAPFIFRSIRIDVYTR